jgi:hypothetical protein
MKNLLLLFSLCFLVLFSCSSDEAESDNNSITFLEKYESTIWQSEREFDGENLITYMRFINYELNPFEFWEIWDSTDCYNYYDSVGISGDLSILVNNNDTLEFEYRIVNNGDIIIFRTKFTASFSSIQAETKEYFNENLTNTVTRTWSRENEEVDDFIEC